MIAHWIIDQLIQQGVEHFCIAPGSRSTPLVNAIAHHPKAKTHVHFDERGLAFFALGLSKATEKPPVVITTSGTAVGNLLPAVMEAHHSSTPLLLFTADRSTGLKECGANQTTDQTKIFSSFVRWQMEIGGSISEKEARSIAAQSYFGAIQNPPGPVHLNCLFQEPLYLPFSSTASGPAFEFHFPRLQTTPYQTHQSKGVILIGRLPKQQDLFPILELGKRLQWPVCADILSNARSYPTREQIRYFDWIEKPTPSLVLHFGERMTSKKIIEWLKNINAELLHISPWPMLQDPERILTGRIQGDITSFCQTFQANHDPEWFSSWNDEAPIFEETGLFTEVHAIRSISQIIPAGYGIFLGNGMPIRDADHFLFPSSCKGYFANRGLSGIDGNIATIAGLAEKMPMFAMIGDQATLHDLNSLSLLKKAAHPITLLISNNFGGGIFHHLPVSQSPHFEKLWAASHNLTFQKAAELFEIPYFSFQEIKKAFHRISMVELITDRSANHTYVNQCLQKKS